MTYQPRQPAPTGDEPRLAVPPYTLVLEGGALRYALSAYDRYGRGAAVALQVIDAMEATKLAQPPRGLTTRGRQFLTKVGGPIRWAGRSSGRMEACTRCIGGRVYWERQPPYPARQVCVNCGGEVGGRRPAPTPRQRLPRVPRKSSKIARRRT